MKRLILFVLLFTVLYAETTKIDSLEIKLTETSGNVKAEIYRKLALEYRTLQQYNEAEEYCEKGIKFATDRDTLATIYYALGNIRFYNCRYEESLKAVEKCIELRQVMGDKIKLAEAIMASATVMTTIGDYDKAIQKYKTAQNIYIELNDNNGIYRTINDLSVILQQQGKLEEAVANMQNAIVLINDDNLMATAYYNLGLFCSDMSDFPNAKDYYFKALALFSELDDNKGIAGIYVALGTMYQSLNKTEKALNYYSKALQIEEYVNNNKSYSSLLSKMGNLYYSILNNEKALEYYQQALKITEKLGLKIQTGSNLNSIGTIYSDLKENDKAKFHLEKALKIAEEINSDRLKGQILINLSMLYATNYLDYTKAYQIQKQAIQTLRKINIPSNLAGALIYQALILKELNQFNAGIIHLQEAKEIIATIGDMTLQRDFHQASSEFYEAKKNFAKALSFYQKYTSLKDSIFTETTSAKISELETKHQTIKNKKEIAELKVAKLQIIKQRLFLLIFVLLLFIITIIAFYFLKLKHRLAKLLKIKVAEKNSELQKELVERQKIEKKLMDVERFLAMREISAGIAHEVKNPLTSISSATQMLQDKPITPAEEEAFLNIIAESVSIATNTIIKMLDFTKTKDIDLQKRDTKFLLNRVCKLLRGNFKSNQVTLENKNNLPNLMIDEEYIQSVFVNVINNAINAMPNGGNLTISSATNNDKLYLKFIDNGCGIKPELLEKVFNPFFTTRSDGHGLGLSIANQAMKQHGGTIEITSELNVGTTVTLIFPLIEA